jgi:hypothetical protein
MDSTKINYLNIGLIIVSCIVAFFIPFQLFLFSYGVLGPLHYLTEIGWLHKKNYFTKGKYDFTFLIAICALLLYYSFIKPAKDMTIAADLVVFGFIISFAFVFVKDWLYRVAIVFLSLLVIFYVFRNIPDYFIWAAIFLPTIVHVFIFTWLFMLYGVLKEKSLSGFISLLVLIVCAASFFIIQPQQLNYPVGNYIRTSYHQFDLLNFYLVNTFHMDNLKEVSEIFTANSGFIIMRFIAFAYTYHYLNWFSKTSVIKWHQVPVKTYVFTGAVWLLSVILYAWDYNLGLKVLFFLSFLHVFLEFPLNAVSITGIGKELNAFIKGSR